MQRLRIAFGVLVLLAVSSCTPYAASAQNLTCGLKPIPAVGCRVGRCVNGALGTGVRFQSGALLRTQTDSGRRVPGRAVCRWRLGADLRSESGVVLWLEADPAIGCRIGRCVDGAWEQVCD